MKKHRSFGDQNEECGQSPVLFNWYRENIACCADCVSNKNKSIKKQSELYFMWREIRSATGIGI